MPQALPLVWYPGFRAIQQCGQTDCFVYSCFNTNDQVSVLEYSVFKPPEGRGGKGYADLDVDVAGG